jgi:hypothetical protein
MRIIDIYTSYTFVFASIEVLISDVHLLGTDSLHYHTHGSPDEQELKRKSY